MKNTAQTAVTTVIAALALIHAPTAPAATLVWDGGGGDGLLSTANNWNPNQAPAGGDTLNIADGSTVSHENNLPGGVTINLTGNSTLSPVTTVLRMNSSTINVGSGSSLTGGGFGFDFAGGNLSFDDGAIYGPTSWEQKGSNTITFNLGASGYTTLTPGTLRISGGAANVANATYVVDFASYTGAGGNITLVDFGADAVSLTDAQFQTASFSFLNTGDNITQLALTYDAAADAINLSFVVIPEPSTLALLGIGLVLLVGRRSRQR